MPYRSPVIAEMFDGDYAVMRTPSGDVDFYVEEARRSGGPVLELGCGTGRILVPTARAGVEITGVDASAGMLARARRTLAAEPAEVQRRVTLCDADMRAVDAGRRFALVTCPFRSVSHLLEVDDQLATFRNVRRHLASGGRVVLDVFHPDPAYLGGPREETLDVERDEGRYRIRRFSSTRPRLGLQLLDITLRWEVLGPSGEITRPTVTFPMRWYHRFELEHLLARCGLRVIALYGDFRPGPFGDESSEMVVVAEAREA